MERYQHEGGSRKLPWARCLPAAVLLVALLTDLVWPPFNTFPLLATVSLIAAPMFSLAWTVGSGAIACLVGWLLSFRESQEVLTRANVIGFTTLITLTVVAGFLNRMFAREREQLRTSRQVAEAVQRAVLPTTPDRVRGLAVATRYQAAQEEALIGGDLYAVHDTPHGLRMVIGDVRGKGMQAVRLVNTLLGAFHAVALRLPDLPSVVQAVEAQVQDVKARQDDAPYEDFVTAVFVEILPDRSALRMANRGHPAPLLVHAGEVTVLEPEEPSLPLGLGDLAGPAVPVDRCELPPGATLVMFTDGIIEARDRDGVFFDPVPPLTGPLPADPGAVLDTMLTALFRHTKDLEDDAAALAVTRLPDDDPNENTPAPPRAAG
ncbi:MULTISPECIES: PP2C family protein-serine/threonine phosphatase [Streptomyces]|uniref:Serine/threonine-protein phosphatase n=1 Tax=Streptomyces tendae TaxID=1932 RepID=A0ABX5ZZ87_STRTE|nr:PP2C family protein-serine/threonine phosphatase [Streptomyces tendae]QER89723.1 serine/threonine-protein phosphatase [Streptomyces tendae]